MKNYVIKITGGGTLENIINALRVVTDELAEELKNNPVKEIDDIEWEDPTLMTLISEEEL